MPHALAQIVGLVLAVGAAGAMHGAWAAAFAAGLAITIVSAALEATDR